MRMLAVIPARGGSQRLPGKNIRILHGVPLIGWSILQAKQSGIFSDVLVSTDDEIIADIAQRYGALVPGLRPKELATDIATTVDTVLYEKEVYEHSHEKVDSLMLLQPTAPFRTPDLIRKAAALHTRHQRSIISVSAASSHPFWCYTINQDRLHPFISTDLSMQRSQDLPKAYALNGSIYIVSAKTLQITRSFHDPLAYPLLCERPEEAIDIDTPWDWLIAETAAPHYFSNQ